MKSLRLKYTFNKMENEQQALIDFENALRDIISLVLSNLFGPDWEYKCGVSPDRVKKWEEKREEEKKRIKNGELEGRLIYFSDFYDLRGIVEHNWVHFQPIFHDKKAFGVDFEKLEKFRNPNAHGRTVLDHQKKLIIGITTEFRNAMAYYRSKIETDEGFFPQIESVRDNYGHVWSVGQHKSVVTNFLLHPGDKIEFTVLASDPKGGKLFYGLHPRTVHLGEWFESNVIRIDLTEEHFGLPHTFVIVVKSDRTGHKETYHDDVVTFSYRIRPKK